jgi:hypothetical protein
MVPASTHLNEQAGESGWQLSTSCLDVVLHQEAHAPDSTHCNGDLWNMEQARQMKASLSLLGAAELWETHSP